MATPTRHALNAVTVDDYGREYTGTLTHFSGVFYERNVGTEDTPAYVSARKDEPGSIARVRAFVRFADLANRAGAPLELSTMIRFSFVPQSSLTLLLASMGGVAPSTVARSKPQPNTYSGRSVVVSLKPGRNGFAMIAKIVRAASVGSTSVAA